MTTSYYVYIYIYYSNTCLLLICVLAAARSLNDKESKTCTRVSTTHSNPNRCFRFLSRYFSVWASDTKCLWSYLLGKCAVSISNCAPQNSTVPCVHLGNRRPPCTASTCAVTWSPHTSTSLLVHEARLLLCKWAWNISNTRVEMADSGRCGISERI